MTKKRRFSLSFIIASGLCFLIIVTTAFLLIRTVTRSDIAVVTTTEGVIKIKLYKKEAPLAVENFIRLAQEGYYNDMLVYKVIPNFMIQTGDPTNTGLGGKSVFEQGGFPNELSEKRRHYRGAVCTANKGRDYTNNSQFYIVVAGPDTITDQSFEDNGLMDFPYHVRKKYKKLGGIPQNDGINTVFGEVIEGMDVVDRIANVATKPNEYLQAINPDAVLSDDQPINDIRIKSIIFIKD